MLQAITKVSLWVSCLHRCPCHNLRRWKVKVRQFSTHLSEETPVSTIRNFSIIAHVDHGKSTLADRLLEMTGAIKETKDNKQVLDRLPVEKERGITVKAVAATLKYTYEGQEYQLNLIDTPGHVDFANEVSRSLAACQGVVLLIDANEGIQAQTVANFYLAFAADKIIIPVLNKIDLKNANPARVEAQLKSLFDMEPETVHRISAKTGQGVDDLLKRIIREIPSPLVERDAPFRALVVDSWYDRFRGALSFVYVVDGHVRVGDYVTSVDSGQSYQVKTVCKLTPEEQATAVLLAGEVGVLSCNMKTAGEAIVGDTLAKKGETLNRLPGFSPAKPMVFAGVYPTDQSQHGALRSAIEKLSLNDPAVSVALDTSPALGYGWRLGFLGLLHLDVFSQRLEQEYGTEAVLTAPSVTYKVRIFGAKTIKQYGGEEIVVSNPVLLPDAQNIREILEPFVMATILTPNKHIGDVLSMCLEKRGVQEESTYIDDDRVMMKFLLPLSEVIVDFHDLLKSITSGYASFDYEDHGFRVSHLVRLNILLNGKQVDELTTIVHGSRASAAGRRMVQRLKELIPRQMVEIAIQAVVGGTVVARETLKAYRKDVAAKLYGGDITRRMKLMKQQAVGKKNMRMVANINVPKGIFIDVLRRK